MRDRKGILKNATSNWQKFTVGRNGQIHQELLINKDDPTKMVFRDVLPGSEVDRILERNQRARNDGINTKAHGRLAATVPAPHWYKWRRDWLDNASKMMSWPEYRARKLNDREFSKFRVGVDRI